MELLDPDNQRWACRLLAGSKDCAVVGTLAAMVGRKKSPSKLGVPPFLNTNLRGVPRHNMYTSFAALRGLTRMKVAVQHGCCADLHVECHHFIFPLWNHRHMPNWANSDQRDNTCVSVVYVAGFELPCHFN